MLRIGSYKWIGRSTGELELKKLRLYTLFLNVRYQNDTSTRNKKTGATPTLEKQVHRDSNIEKVECRLVDL